MDLNNNGKNDVEELAGIVIKDDETLKKALEDIKAVTEFVATTKTKPTFRIVNDKDLVIIGAVAIALCAMFFIPDPTNIIMNIITGMFGIATGRAMGAAGSADDRK
jgi:hypothetical protein